MTDTELQAEVRYIDMLPSAQRHIYFEEVSKARGKEVERMLREALVALWKSWR
jgi:hypothetical protein